MNHYLTESALFDWPTDDEPVTFVDGRYQWCGKHAHSECDHPFKERERLGLFMIAMSMFEGGRPLPEVITPAFREIIADAVQEAIL